MHLCLEDIRVDSHEKPSMLQMVIKCSKMDPYRLGVSLYIGAINTELCPVAAVIDCMLTRGKKKGSLFLRKDGRCLIGENFVQAAGSVMICGLN